MLDGEVVIWRAGRLDFGALQDRVRSGPVRARGLALELPAAYVVFDLLAVDGTDLRGQPYTERRRVLEELLGADAPEAEDAPVGEPAANGAAVDGRVPAGSV